MKAHSQHRHIGASATGRAGGCAGGAGSGTPHDLVLALLLLALAQDDALDDGALLRREVRQVRHVVHGGRAAGGARTRRELRSCAARPRHSASLAPEVYLIMPGGQWRDCKLTSARLLIAPAPLQRQRAPPRRRRAPSLVRCVRMAPSQTLAVLFIYLLAT